MAEYIIRFKMCGAFPGSPDYDYAKITGEEWVFIRDLVGLARIADTEEMAKRLT